MRIYTWSTIDRVQSSPRSEPRLYRRHFSQAKNGSASEKRRQLAVCGQRAVDQAPGNLLCEGMVLGECQSHWEWDVDDDSPDSRKKVKKAGVAAPVVEEAEVGVEGPGDDAGDEVGI